MALVGNQRAVPQDARCAVAGEEVGNVGIQHEFMRSARIHEVHIKDAVPTQLPLYAGIDLSGVRGGKIVAVEPATALNSEAGQRVGGCGNEDLWSRESHGDR